MFKRSEGLFGGKFETRLSLVGERASINFRMYLRATARLSMTPSGLDWIPPRDAPLILRNGSPHQYFTGIQCGGKTHVATHIDYWGWEKRTGALSREAAPLSNPWGIYSEDIVLFRASHFSPSSRHVVESAEIPAGQFRPPSPGVWK